MKENKGFWKRFHQQMDPFDWALILCNPFIYFPLAYSYYLSTRYKSIPQCNNPKWIKMANGKMCENCGQWIDK
jgi:hypothetical protein